MILTLIRTDHPAKHVQTFKFRSDAPVVYQAGQHINLRLQHETPDDRGTIRTFTLSSSPTEEDVLAITTRTGESTFKKALFALPIGSTIEARGPGGGFILRQGAGHHIMIAGGMGITPFRSMLRYMADSGLTDPVTLIYSVKTPADIVFGEELDRLKEKVSLTVVYTVTRPDTSDWNGRTGRIDASLIAQVSRPNSRYYIAGPSPFVENVIAVITGMGTAPERIYFEKFPGYTE